MIIKRDLTKVLERFSKFPAIAMLGPRQSGKTTLVKDYFNKHVYFSLEDPEVLAFVTQDPKGSVFFDNSSLKMRFKCSFTCV